MATHRISTPAPGHTGQVGGVMFQDGHADIDAAENAAEMAYFRSAGYGVEEIGDVEAPAPVAVVEQGELPRKSASAAAWREYAVANGMDKDEADGLSRDELVARYSKEESK